MCQAKIVDHYSSKYRCLRPDEVTYDVTIEYGYGHMKGKIKKFTRTLCQKHAKIFRYNCNVKAKKGHIVTIDTI